MSVLVVAGWALHELWARTLVAEDVAAMLLARGGGADGSEALMGMGAVLFLLYRVIAFPIAGAVIALGALSILAALQGKALEIVNRARSIRVGS